MAITGICEGKEHMLGFQRVHYCSVHAVAWNDM